MSDTFRDQLQDALSSAYALDREITGGGMSRVYVATERSLGRTVVVKVLRPDLAAGVNRERFRREIMLAAQLQHPHIVPLLSAGEHGELLWYTMPFVEGESLREALARRQRFTARDVTRVLHDVLDALAYAHGRGVIHRDIKPGNILRHGTHSLVTDFGVAKALSASMPHSGTTSVGVAIGTPAYMAPEQLAADPRADHRMDLYAVGLLAYELLSGEQPFGGLSPQATMAAQLTRMPESLEERFPDVPAPLAGLVMRLLDKHPENRPPTAMAALEELDAMMTPQSGVTAPTPTAPRAAAAGAAESVTPTSGAGSAAPATPPPGDRATRRLAMLVAAGLLAAVAGVYAGSQLLRPAADATSGGPAMRIGRADTSGSLLSTPPPPSALQPRGAADTGRTPPRGDAPGAPGTSAGDSMPAKAVGGPAAAAARGDSARRDSVRGTAGRRDTTRRDTSRARTQQAAPERARAVSPAPPAPRRAAPPPDPARSTRRVALLPVRDATARPQLAPVARALEDSLRRALTSAGYSLASDAELVRLLASTDQSAQRRTADGSGIGAIVTGLVTVRGEELIAQALIHDVWRNAPMSERDESELDDPDGALAVVRDVMRALDRVSWRNRADPRRVIVFDFDNNTGRDEMAPTVRVLADSLRRAARRLGLEPVSDSQAVVTTGTSERRRMGEQLGVGALVAGSVYRRGSDSLMVRLSVRDMSEERTFNPVEIRGPLDTPLAVLPELAKVLAAEIGKVNWGPKGMAQTAPTGRAP